MGEFGECQEYLLETKDKVIPLYLDSSTPDTEEAERKIHIDIAEDVHEKINVGNDEQLYKANPEAKKRNFQQHTQARNEMRAASTSTLNSIQMPKVTTRQTKIVKKNAEPTKCLKKSKSKTSSYQWINWANNSCRLDTFMTIFNLLLYDRDESFQILDAGPISLTYNKVLEIAEELNLGGNSEAIDRLWLHLVDLAVETIEEYQRFGSPITLFNILNHKLGENLIF